MDAATLTLGVLAVAAIFFATEIIPLAVTAMGAAVALGLLGVLTPKEVFAGLSNSTVVLFAGMFVIGAAMFQTGLAQWIGIAVVKKSGTNGRALMRRRCSARRAIWISGSRRAGTGATAQMRCASLVLRTTDQ